MEDGLNDLTDLAETIAHIFSTYTFQATPTFETRPGSDNSCELCMDHGSIVHPTIRKEMKAFFQVGHHATMDIRNIHISYTFWDVHQNSKIAKFMLRYACFILHLLMTLKGLQTHSHDHTNKRHLKLVLVNYTREKIAPLEGEPLSSLHVNSGVTIKRENEAEIHVYRKEEMIKVLTHELIHYMDVGSQFIHPFNERRLSDAFCIPTKRTILANEAFTEAFACILNTIMYTIFSKPQTALQQTVIHNYKKEMHFSHIQALKVLDKIKIQSCTYNTNVNTEETHATSYYVLKYLLIYNLAAFLRYLKENSYTIKDRDRFISMLEGYVESFKRDFSNEKKVSNNKSMKMTSLDISALLFMHHTNSI
jgi:hypothetical protein